MKTFAISIPKPCHEDWNKMTPDAKGAFCASCQKSVYDFSNKSDEEIIAVFEKEEKGKVCGRFSPAQLSRPVVSFGNESSTSSRLAVFLYALLLAFGATLFSGADAFAQEVKGDVKVKIMGKMAYHPIEIVNDVEADTVIQEKKPVKACGTSQIINNELSVLGGAVAIEEPVIIKSMGDTIITEIGETPIDTVVTEVLEVPPVDVVEPQIVMPVMGSVAYVPIPQELIPPTNETTEDKPAVCECIADSTKVIIENNLPDLNEPTVITEVESAIEEDVIDDNSKAVTETNIFPSSDLDVNVSPNPSGGLVTLSYTLETAMPVRIDLYDITGKFVKTLTQQGNQYAGKYNVSYNIADLQNGIYFATLIAKDKKSSAKIILTK